MGQFKAVLIHLLLSLILLFFEKGLELVQFILLHLVQIYHFLGLLLDVERSECSTMSNDVLISLNEFLGTHTSSV